MAVLMLLLWLVVIPFLMGLPFGERKKNSGFSPYFALACGYMLQWALFFIIAVGVIFTTNQFDLVVNLFWWLSIVLSLCCLAFFVWKKKREGKSSHNSFDIRKVTPFAAVVWVLFFALLIFQLYQGAAMAFADGDDAYYIPISGITEAGGSMYRVLSYTGETSSLDIRHALAPFPIWIAFLSRVSGVASTILAQTLLSMILLLVCYMIYYEIAKELFREQKDGVAAFMLFVSIMHIMGNYSNYTAATFLITRTSQGKAVLSNLVIPFLFLVLLHIVRNWEMDKKERNLSNLFLLLAGSVASWLCSSMGAFLSAVLIGGLGVILAIRHRSIRIFAYMEGCAIPCGAFAIAYLLLR